MDLGVLGGGVKSGYTFHTKPALFVSRITPIPEYVSVGCVVLGGGAGCGPRGPVADGPTPEHSRREVSYRRMAFSSPALIDNRGCSAPDANSALISDDVLVATLGRLCVARVVFVTSFALMN